MTSSHSDTILERLHDQYLKELDCDVIITAIDHLETNVSESMNGSSNEDVVWKSLYCHKNVLRAASCFFDRVFANNFTYEKLEVDEGVEGMLVRNENDDRTSLQIVLHRISSHSVQALVNFAYTGFAAVETSILRRAIEDCKLMNALAVIDKLESRLEEPLSVENCISNLIISYTLDKNEKYREILRFILQKFIRILKPRLDQINDVGADLSISEMNTRISTEFKRETDEWEKLGLTVYKNWVTILLKLMESMCIRDDEEAKLSTFMLTKRRGTCFVHLEVSNMYCHTDDQEICVECLVDGHVKHHIEPIGRAMYKRYAPFWEKVNLKLEHIKNSARARIKELDIMTGTLLTEKSRDFEILGHCFEIKPKIEKLSNIFSATKIDPNDENLFSLEHFVTALANGSIRSDEEFEKLQQISAQLPIMARERCSNYALIAGTAETPEDLEKIDLDQPLSIDNCISKLGRSEKMKNQQTYDEAFEFLMTNFSDVMKQNRRGSLRKISPHLVIDLLKTDRLRVESEDDVVSIVIEWLEVDYQERKKFETEILKEVRFGCVSENLLKGIQGSPNHIIMKNAESKKWLQDAIEGGGNRYPRDSTVMKLLAFGDYGSNMIFNVFTHKWEQWQGRNNGRGFSVVLIGENIFNIGGYSEDNQSLSTVSIYNKRKKTWKAGPTLLKARYDFGACVSSTKTIYVLGGYTSKGKSSRSVEMLNCNEDGEPIGSWRAFTPMKESRSNFEAAIVDDRIYAIGGYFNSATIEVFDHGLKGWRSCKAMSQGKHSYSCSTYNGEIYVFGRDGFCEKYNPVTNACSTIAAFEGTTYNRGSTVLNDKIYLVGGSNSSAVNIYDIKSNKWSKGPSLPSNIGWTKCVACKYNP